LANNKCYVTRTDFNASIAIAILTDIYCSYFRHSHAVILVSHPCKICRRPNSEQSDHIRDREK